jgi:hypothetical protein
MGLGFLIVAGAPDVRVLTAGLLVRGAAAGVYRPAGLTLISRGAGAARCSPATGPRATSASRSDRCSRPSC